MFDYLPQLFIGLFFIIVGLFISNFIIAIWRWIGLNFLFRPPLEASYLPAAIWMKTLPLLIYCSVMPFALRVTVAILDIPGISEPVTHKLNKIIATPVLFIGGLLFISGVHIYMLKTANKGSSN